MQTVQPREIANYEHCASYSALASSFRSCSPPAAGASFSTYLGGSDWRHGAANSVPRKKPIVVGTKTTIHSEKTLKVIMVAHTLRGDEEGQGQLTVAGEGARESDALEEHGVEDGRKRERQERQRAERDCGLRRSARSRSTRLS